jgi:hypothetical protein
MLERGLEKERKERERDSWVKGRILAKISLRVQEVLEHQRITVHLKGSKGMGEPS